VRTTALVELARIGAKDAAPTVADMLTLPENDPLRVTIVDTLGRLGDRSVHPSLIRVLSDSEVYMQEAARAALKRLAGGKDFGINKHAWRDWFERNP
jgi:HEAT repeat protein